MKRIVVISAIVILFLLQLGLIRVQASKNLSSQTIEEINPVLDFTTYIGGNDGDSSYSLALGSDHSIYIAGWTKSADFPTTNNAFSRTRSSSPKDIFVAKLSADGSELLYSTYLGGTSDIFESGSLVALALDSSNNAIVGASTSSSQFPTTPGSFNQTHSGDRDVFIAKLSADGSNLLFSTFIGGNDSDSITAIELDSANNVYFSGQTESRDFPTTAGGYNRTHGGGEDVYVAKLSADGSTLEFSTFVGGSVDDCYPLLALDSQNNIYISGSTSSFNFPTTIDALNYSSNGGNGYSFGDDLTSIDLFVCKISADGSELLYSTYLGGTKSEYVNAIVADSADNIIITGSTGSSDFPSTANAYDPSYNGGNTDPDFVGDIFVTKIAANGSNLMFSTFLGGSSDYEFSRDITLDNDDSIYLTGYTRSTNFPLTSSPFDSDSSYGEAFLSVLSADASELLYSTFLGGSGDDQGLALS